MPSSKVEWTKWPRFSGRNENWSPWVGCTPEQSHGCEHCWARRLEDGRLRHLGRCLTYEERRQDDDPNGDPVEAWRPGRPYFVRGPVYQGDDVLRAPLHWRKPRLVWCCPSSDPFHEDIGDEAIDRMQAVAALCPQHFVLMLTKRAKRMRQYMAAPFLAQNVDKDKCELMGNMSDAGRSVDAYGGEEDSGYFEHGCLANLGLGVTVCTQAEADEKIPLLLQTPAAFRFVSVEPMLEPINARKQLPVLELFDENVMACSRCGCHEDYGSDPQDHECPPGFGGRIDWVIIGCESGPGCRRCPVEWVRSLIGQCRDAAVPCFVKQISVNGKCSREMSEWPADLRVREWPDVALTPQAGGKEQNV